MCDSTSYFHRGQAKILKVQTKKKGSRNFFTFDGARNFFRMKSHNLVSSQSDIRRVPPIHRLHFGHLRVDNSNNLSKHSRHSRWLQRSRTGSVQVNLYQKLLFLHQVTHIMTKDFSLNYEIST